MLMIYLWLSACAFVDAREQRVPNALTFPMLGLALLQLAVYQTTLSGAPAWQAALGLAAALVLTLPGFLLGRLGGGDVKLLSALGVASTPGLVIGSFVYGTAALLIWALLTRLRQRTLGEMAFAPSVLVGALVAAWWPLLP